MSESILDSVKKALGIAPEYDAFDSDLILHTNSIFAVLNQIGVGPEDGFMIEDNKATWVDFIGPYKHLNHVKTYVYIRVRLLFDPPQSSHAATSLKEQADELEWRMNVTREGRQ